MPTDRPPLRIGTRASPLALAQARQLRDLLAAADPARPAEIVPMTTTGDTRKGSLAALGGKGAFVKELDRALAAGDVDVCLHCMKDVPGDVPRPQGFIWAAYLRRDDPHDCLLLPAGAPRRGLADLPPGTRVGTSSVRRRAQLRRRHPGLETGEFRGNINSRIARLDAGEYDAAVLAHAGLRRAGLEHRAVEVIASDVLCPAVGSAVLGAECRRDDTVTTEALRALDHPETRTHITAERAMLHALQGHCNSPIAGHATTAPDGRVTLIGMVFAPDGSSWAHARETADRDRPADLGASVADALLTQGARTLIEAVGP
ncbi:hydroxymethylbilane synthase [Nocardiopsis sediminis]|uniref:Porphobilinogen deaminase n=1 Tax=Nocardiopsis sediminis TaxID=1778267 RepID=A0ABV8FRN7_9ACTN